MFADDGTVAVDIVEGLMASGIRLDCVILDFTMITMHGPEAASKMRSLGYDHQLNDFWFTILDI